MGLLHESKISIKLLSYSLIVDLVSSQFKCMGASEGGPRLPRFWNYWQKKVVFSISRGEKQISPPLASPWKNFWEKNLLAPPWKRSFRRPCSNLNTDWWVLLIFFLKLTSVLAVYFFKNLYFLDPLMILPANLLLRNTKGNHPSFIILLSVCDLQVQIQQYI